MFQPILFVTIFQHHCCQIFISGMIADRIRLHSVLLPVFIVLTWVKLCLTSSFNSFPLLICSWYQILAVEINSSQERYHHQYKYRIENENLKVLLDNLFCTGVHFFFGRGRRGKCKRMLSSYLQVFVIKCYWQLDFLYVVFLRVLIADCGKLLLKIKCHHFQRGLKIFLQKTESN